MGTEIKHNGVVLDEHFVDKTFKSTKGFVYSATAHLFSDVVQYPVFGRRFFEWPLALRAKVRAEREYIYADLVRELLDQLGNEVNGVPFHAIPFLSLQGDVIRMERAHGYKSVFELLKDPTLITDRGKLADCIEAYGAWTAELCNHGVVPECNHCGNIMVDEEKNEQVILIDFENYSGTIDTHQANPDYTPKYKHRMTDKSVNPITSLGLDIGILAGMKLPQEEKAFYTENYVIGFSRQFCPTECDEPRQRLETLLGDRRVRTLGLTRGVFYDTTHLAERKEGPAASYFKRDYAQLCDVAIKCFNTV